MGMGMDTDGSRKALKRAEADMALQKAGLPGLEDIARLLMPLAQAHERLGRADLDDRTGIAVTARMEDARAAAAAVALIGEPPAAPLTTMADVRQRMEARRDAEWFAGMAEPWAPEQRRPDPWKSGRAPYMAEEMAALGRNPAGFYTVCAASALNKSHGPVHFLIVDELEASRDGSESVAEYMRPDWLFRGPPGVRRGHDHTAASGRRAWTHPSLEDSRSADAWAPPKEADAEDAGAFADPQADGVDRQNFTGGDSSCL